MSRRKGDVAAILLAAGRGMRFGGEPKLLAQIGGKALVRHVAEAALQSTADPVIAVTGYRADEVQEALNGLPVEIVHNDLYSQGLSTSLKTGFSALPEKACAAVILLADMPFVKAGLIDALAEGWRESGKPSALVPTFEGRRGNPVVISRHLQTVVEGLSGDAGAGQVLRWRTDVLEWSTNDIAVIQDIDTREELAKHRI